jgi:hypothetical protein
VLPLQQKFKALRENSTPSEIALLQLRNSPPVAKLMKVLVNHEKRKLPKIVHTSSFFFSTTLALTSKGRGTPMNAVKLNTLYLFCLFPSTTTKFYSSPIHYFHSLRGFSFAITNLTNRRSQSLIKCFELITTKKSFRKSFTSPPPPPPPPPASLLHRVAREQVAHQCTQPKLYKQKKSANRRRLNAAATQACISSHLESSNAKSPK